MSPQGEKERLDRMEPDEGLEGTADELEERLDRLGHHSDDAKQGLRARREDADEDPDLLDDEDLGDDEEDPLAFDDPEADDIDDEE